MEHTEEEIYTFQGKNEFEWYRSCFDYETCISEMDEKLINIVHSYILTIFRVDEYILWSLKYVSICFVDFISGIM